MSFRQLRSWSRVFTDQEGRKCVLQNSRLLCLQFLLCRPGLVVQASVLLKHQPTGQLKRTRPLTSYPVSQSRVFTKLVTCFHRPGHEVNHVIHRTRRSEMVGRSEAGHVIHRPGHKADRHLQSANHVSF